MTRYLWLSKSRKNLSSRTSMLLGWIIVGVPRVQADPSGLDLGPDVAVGEQHGVRVPAGCSGCGRCLSEARGWVRLPGAGEVRWAVCTRHADVAQW